MGDTHSLWVNCSAIMFLLIASLGRHGSKGSPGVTKSATLTHWPAFVRHSLPFPPSRPPSAHNFLPPHFFRYGHLPVIPIFTFPPIHPSPRFHTFHPNLPFFQIRPSLNSTRWWFFTALVLLWCVYSSTWKLSFRCNALAWKSIALGSEMCNNWTWLTNVSLDQLSSISVSLTLYHTV